MSGGELLEGEITGAGACTVNEGCSECCGLGRGGIGGVNGAGSGVDAGGGTKGFGIGVEGGIGGVSGAGSGVAAGGGTKRCGVEVEGLGDIEDGRPFDI